MNILSFKPGHDGQVAYVVDGHLIFSNEAEKDAGLRYAPLDVSMVIETLCLLPDFPDVIAISGWHQGLKPHDRPIGAGYTGLKSNSIQEVGIFGKPAKVFSSSHERSHILCSYALSPFPQGQPCYVLIWEGHLGAFYFVDNNLRIEKLVDIMVDPGIRYAFAYALVDPSFNLPPGQIRLGDAGKLMALAAFDNESPVPTLDEQQLLEKIFAESLNSTYFQKTQFSRFSEYNAGVESALSKRLAKLVSNYIFEYFHNKLKPFVSKSYPLLIGGGCGLNCDWNRAWLDSALFSEVFVPPCTNDTGSAIGTAVDAQFHLTGNGKLNWSVYCGQSFIDDLGIAEKNTIGEFHRLTMDMNTIANLINRGAILGWIQGKAEIGPRALGNRSILAAPFSKETLYRINTIKRREQYRPIAPVCLAEDVSVHFDLNHTSPWMLYFAKVKNPRLNAVTHVDGSARPQTICRQSNPLLYQLLLDFKKITGDGVLCNTSLNFNGTGFINRTSDLLRYAAESDLDGFVIEGIAFINNKNRERFCDDIKTPFI